MKIIYPFYIVLQFLTLFKMGLFGAAHGWREAQKAPPLENLSHIFYIGESWYTYTLTKEDPKNT